MLNGHGTRMHRVGSAKPPAQKLDAIHPRPALRFCARAVLARRQSRTSKGLTMSQRRTELETVRRRANRAAKQGDYAAAERWSKTAERLAAAAETVSTKRDAEEEERRLAQDEAEQMICDLFAKAAFIANAMVHAPMQAPAAFQGLVKLWREQNLGEGEADAERAAAKLAQAQAAYLEGRFEDTLPDYVRERIDVEWKARRAELEGRPIVPAQWECG
jgi:hypothetical protein